MPENMKICRFLPRNHCPMAWTEFSAVRAYTPNTVTFTVQLINKCKILSGNLSVVFSQTVRRVKINLTELSPKQI